MKNKEKRIANKSIANAFGITYFKVAPTEYVYHMSNNKILHEGKGIGFWCNIRKDNVLLVPLSEWDDAFTATHRCKDDQDVKVKGKVLYQIITPGTFIENFNYSINPVSRARYTTDSIRLVSRIVDLVSDSLRVRVREISLTDLLNEKRDLGSIVKNDITDRISEWGVRCNGVYISSIVPSSIELVDALEAPYREKTLLSGEMEKLARAEALAKEGHKDRLEALKRERQLYDARLNVLDAKRNEAIQEAETSAATDKIKYAALAQVPDIVLFTEAMRRANYLVVTPDTISEFVKYRSDKR